MKTINGKFFRPAAFLLAAFLWLSFFSLPAVIGVEKMPPQRFFIALAAGCFYPQQGVFREIYGNALWPVELQMELALGRKISVFGAARYLETSGSTVLLSPRQLDETYALRWQMATLRLGVNYRLSSSRFSPFVGLGGSCSYFREHWPEAAATNEGWKGGFFIQAGGRYRLSRSWHALVQLEYSVVPAGSGAQGKVNLGGLSLLLGLLAGIF
jgi:hypothetical protein